ncbi:MAG: hypothetical protein IKV97_07315 [Clostridia bacterium]|nr:hypothetical protein [Clostridia bacterium]
MRKKLLSLVLSLCMILSVCSFYAGATTGKLSMDKTVFSLGEDIVFNYHDSASEKDFVSIYYASNPGGTNSSNGELAWAYTKSASGTVKTSNFNNTGWASTPGKYLAKYWSADQYKVLLDSVYFTIIDPAEAEFTEYYVKKGGTGDGHSADSPMGTIVDIVKTINKGHIAGDEVTVYVIDSGEASKTVIDSDCVIGYNNSALGQVPSHDATITYTSYAENVTSIIGHVNYQGAGSNAIHLLLAGPSKFENINILDMRNSNNGGTDIYLGNHSVSFNGVKFMDLKGANQGTMGEIFYPSSTHFLLGQTRGKKMVTGDAEVYLDNASLIGDYLSLTGYNDDTQTQGVDGDLTLRIGSGTLKNLYISSTRADEVVTGNASIVLGKGVKVSRLLAASNGKNLIVNGALQLVKNYGATVPADHAAAAHASTARDSFAPYYELSSMSDAITLDVTDTAGNFSVQTDGVAYAVSEDGLTVYYGTDTLTLPAGRFTVYSAEDLEAVKNEAPKPSSDEVGIIFKGWNDDGQKLTAIFGMRDPVLKDYYVKPGGTGDGRTESAPAGTIGSVIDSINADGLEAIDTATVHIIRTEEDSKTSWQKIVTKTGDAETVVKDEVSAINFVGYETAKAHNAKIIYEGESAENLSTIVFAKSWGVTGNPGTHVPLKGPSEFKNIRLIDPRFSHYWVVYSRNFDLSFTGNSVIRKASLKTASATNDDGSTTTTYTISLGSWYGVLYSAYHYSENSKPIGGATFKINPSLINNKINLTSDVASTSTPTITVAEDTTLVLYGSGTQNDVELAGITTATYNYNKNVNIMLDGASLKNLLNTDAATVGGALQIIMQKGAKLTKDGSGIENKYIIETADGVSAEFTETAGTFNVSGGNIIYTVSEDGKSMRYTANGTFTAPAYGTYKLFAADSLEALKALGAPAPDEGMEFAGWFEETSGILTAKYQPRTPKNQTYYVKWGGTGNGLTKEAPMASVKEAILAANATGELIKGDTITVYVMDDDTHTALETYNEAHPEFWKYSADGRYIFNNGNLKNVEGRFTTWGVGAGEENPAHVATLIVTSLDASKPAHIAQHKYIGQNTAVILGGPTIIRDINYVTTRKYDRETSTNGYDCTFENVTFYYQDSDNAQTNGTYLWGLKPGHFRTLLNHYSLSAVDGPGGTLRLESAIDATGGTYGLEITGARGANFTSPVNIYFDHEDLNLELYWGRGATSVSTFGKGLNLVINNGTVTTNDKFTGKVNVTGGLTVIANNGCTLPALPANVTADKVWKLAVPENGTLDITETAGTFKADTSKQYWFAVNDDFSFIYGKVSDGSIKLPAGSYNVYFTDSDPVENDCAAVRATLPEYYSTRLTFTKVSDGVYSAQLSKVRQVMKMTDPATSNGHFEEGSAATATYPYVGEVTTLHGFTVKKVTRNTDYETGKANPLIYKYSPILDENGKQVSVANARYISFRYYYAPGEGSNAPLVGKTAKWTQGKLGSGSWVSGIEATSRDTYVANSWATMTIDMWSNSKYKNNALNDAGVLSQYKFAFLNGTHLHDTDTLYISDVIFTNYDPAEELAIPVMYHISENGNDANDGKSVGTAVKTIARAMELAKDEKSMLFSIHGNVSEGTYTATYPELYAILVKGDSAANIENLTTACNITVEDAIAENINVANGMTATLKGDFDGNVTVTNGVVVADTEISVTVSNEACAFIDVVNGSISELNILGNANELAVDIPYSGAVKNVNVSENAVVKDIMTVTGYGVEIPAEIENLSVTGRKISVKTPIMKASTGEPFDVTPIGFGKVKTYSGTAYNFGAGHVTYTAYTVSPDGYTAYYSNAKTGYVMTLGQSGTYQLDIACETGYNYSGNASKPVAGFSPNTHLTLPEGALGWLDDGCGTITAKTSGGDDTAPGKTVYVSNRYGSDENDGLTAETALKTIRAAVHAIGLSNDGTIMVLDGKDAQGNPEYTVYTRFKDSVNGAYVYTPEKLPINNITQDVLFYDAPAHTGTITYEGDAPDSVILSGANHLELAGPTVFKNISYIEGYNTGKNLVTRGQSFEIAGEVYKIPTYVADSTGGAANRGLAAPTRSFPVDTVGRSNSSATGRLVLPEGYSGTVSFCAWDGSYTHSGAQTLVVNGANVTSVNIGNKAGTNHNILSIVYNSGKIGKIYNAATPIATTAKAVQIICNNGLSISENTSSLAGSLGNWYINSAEVSGCALDVTGTAGTFAVSGGKFAKAQNSDGAVIYSDNGMLTLPAGTWNVTYSDVLPYEVSNGTVTANENVEIALSELDGALDSENGAFLGWAYDAQGTEFVDGTTVTLDAGEKLYAIYRSVDKNVGGDISVLGAQIRLASNEVKQGLRFVSRINKSLLSDIGITDIGGQNVKYGSVVLPENLMGEGELTLGYVNGNYAAATVPAVSTYRNDTNSVTYTAVLTDISNKNLTRLYKVRPYISYTDNNGTERTIYGESYSTGVYAVAAYALETDTTLSNDAVSVLEEIKAAAVATLDDPVSIVAYKNAPASYAEATAEQFAKGEVFYKNADGMVIREVHIPGAKKETTAGVLTDTHINLLNEKDKYDPELQLTYFTRTWLRNGLTINAINKSAAIASMYDQIIFTGDIIDYLSYGALDALKENVFDKYPSGLYALGGHDVTRNMETGLSDKTPLAERQALLQEYWPHDIFYASRVVNDSVMFIQLDNGCSRYWESQVDTLAADIEKARENGYVVLIFQHEPINSGDPTATEVISYDAADLNNFWYGENRVHYGQNADAATKAVYELITKNADVVRGVFAGHTHLSAYVEIKASYVDENGETVETTIPQYVTRPVAYETNNGSITKIVVTAE